MAICPANVLRLCTIMKIGINAVFYRDSIFLNFYTPCYANLVALSHLPLKVPLWFCYKALADWDRLNGFLSATMNESSAALLASDFSIIYMTPLP